MTELDLTAIKARTEAATEGPWRVDTVGGEPYVAVGVISHEIDYALALGREQGVRDATFIADARTDVPALVAEVERLRDLREAERHVQRMQVAGFEAENAALAAQVEQVRAVVDDLDIARAEGRIQTYGQIQRALRRALDGEADRG